MAVVFTVKHDDQNFGVAQHRQLMGFFDKAAASSRESDGFLTIIFNFGNLNFLSTHFVSVECYYVGINIS